MKNVWIKKDFNVTARTNVFEGIEKDVGKQPTFFLMKLGSNGGWEQRRPVEADVLERSERVFIKVSIYFYDHKAFIDDEAKYL